MAKEILFKAKRLDSGEWVEGYYLPIKEKVYIIFEAETSCMDAENTDLYATEWYEVMPETICQYPGLNDKNGKKIWENDIVRCGRNVIVTWDEHFASWCLTRKGWLYKHFFGESQNPEDCEVVGNIFDNPDLLEENHE